VITPAAGNQNLGSLYFPNPEEGMAAILDLATGIVTIQPLGD